MLIEFVKNAPNAKKGDIKQVPIIQANILIKLGIAKQHIKTAKNTVKNSYSDFNKDKLLAECEKRQLASTKKMTKKQLTDLLITDDINKESN